MNNNAVAFHKTSLFIIALIGLLYNFYTTFGYTMDDALITLRYSLKFGTTGLPIWNQADITNPTMGYTSPLWMALNTVQVLFTTNKDTVVLISKFWSLAFLLTFTYLIVSIINKQNIQFYKKAMYTILLMWNPVFSFHVSSGMETIFFSTALSLYAVAIVKYPKQYTFLILFGLLLFFIRPEGILALGVYWTYDLIVNRNYKKSFFSAVGIWTILLSYFYMIYSFYGYPLPSAFYVKQGGPLIKASAIKFTAVFIILSAFPFIFNLIMQRKNINFKNDFFILAFISIFFVFYLTVIPMMNVIYRYQMPVLFLLTLFFAIHAKSFDEISKKYKYAVIFALAFLAIFNMGLANKYATKVSQADDNLRKIGIFLQSYNNYKDWLIYHDAGYVCYYSDMNSIDTIGLNTITIATKQKTIRDYYANPKVKYILDNNVGKTLNSIKPLTMYEKYGFTYLDSIPMSYDGSEYYVVDVFQRDGNIKISDLKNLKPDLEVRKTWFDGLYYYGRKLIKNK